jgi:phosphatidylglycerol---prolipoprotein diacylglyceryl transferase
MRPYVLHWLEHRIGAGPASLLAPSWFMCIGLAGLASLVLMLVLARRSGINAATITSVVLSAYVAAIAGGIVVPMVIHAVSDFVMTGQFRPRWSGMTSFWGYLTGAAALAIACERQRLSVKHVADLAVIPLGAALVFARLGCFMAGCDYGKVSSLPWAVRFPAGSPAWRDHVHAGLVPASRALSLPVHPTELYEALLGVLMIAVALVARRRKLEAGWTFAIAAGVYAAGRLLIETVRGDAGRGVYAGLSSGQIFSLLVLTAIAARLIWGWRHAAAATPELGAL